MEKGGNVLNLTVSNAPTDLKAGEIVDLDQVSPKKGSEDMEQEREDTKIISQSLTSTFSPPTRPKSFSKNTTSPTTTSTPSSKTRKE